MLPPSNFYSRASCEARHILQAFNDGFAISTHAPRVRRDLDPISALWQQLISTHAPRVRRDERRLVQRPELRISTHAPRVRRDLGAAAVTVAKGKFLLTRLV